MALVPSAEAGLRAVARGATVLQLRDPSAETGDLEREAARLVGAVPVPVVVSARVDVALAVGAVFETASHPGQPAAGVERLREVALAVGIPVLAIGGIDETTAELCRQAGAVGFAAIRYFS
jgi:thiamine monophosphate synthase